MIEPTYRRDQLWRSAWRVLPRPTMTGVILGGALAFLFAVAVSPPFTDEVIDDPRPLEANMLVTKLAAERFPRWREHHAGCPHRLSELLSSPRLDPWGHALHYTCDPRLASGGSFAVFSAGADGVFGTPDDIAATDSIAAP